jgi:hypothetical protein
MRHRQLDDGMSEWGYVPATKSYIHQSGDMLCWQGTDGFWYGQRRDVPRTHGPFIHPELVLRSLTDDKQLRKLLTNAGPESRGKRLADEA